MGAEADVSFAVANAAAAAFLLKKYNNNNKQTDR